MADTVTDGRPTRAAISQEQSGWPERYGELAQQLLAAAGRAAPVLISSTVDVDEIYAMDAPRLRSLIERSAVQGGLAAEVAHGVREQLRAERDGELYWDWPQGTRWLQDALGAPDRRQLGGTGPQAAWALDVLGAPSIMALKRRHHEQLSVLPDNVLVCAQGDLVRVRDLRSDDRLPPSKHTILEFSRGSTLLGNPLGRSHRLILRFAPIALEMDLEFLAMQGQLCRMAGAAVVSGLNGLASSDRESLEWTGKVTRMWADNGVALRHLELGDTRKPALFREILGHLRGLCSSVGLSLSELWGLWGSGGDVGTKALELAAALGSTCVVIHADQWSLAVHRDDREAIVRRLMVGNLLASARAVRGAPAADLVPFGRARYTDDLPLPGRLPGGWHLDCVPVPHEPHPLSTIGLGDTFTAGLLLAAALELTL